MPGNPDSGKPRIHPGMTVKVPTKDVFKLKERQAAAKIKSIPRATKRPKIVPATPRGSRTVQQNNKRNNELRKLLNKDRRAVRLRMFRTDI